MGCRAADVYKAATATDRRVLKRWFGDGTDTRGRRVSANGLAKALGAVGLRVGPTTLKVHRQKSCACYREG